MSTPKNARKQNARSRALLAHPASFAGTKAAKTTTKDRIEAEMPAWMTDPSLLPKRPPGR